MRTERSSSGVVLSTPVSLQTTCIGTSKVRSTMCSELHSWRKCGQSQPFSMTCATGSSHFSCSSGASKISSTAPTTSRKINGVLLMFLLTESHINCLRKKKTLIIFSAKPPKTARGRPHQHAPPRHLCAGPRVAIVWIRGALQGTVWAMVMLCCSCPRALCSCRVLLRIVTKVPTSAAIKSHVEFFLLELLNLLRQPIGPCDTNLIEGVTMISMMFFSSRTCSHRQPHSKCRTISSASNNHLQPCFGRFQDGGSSGPKPLSTALSTLQLPRVMSWHTRSVGFLLESSLNGSDFQTNFLM